MGFSVRFRVAIKTSGMDAKLQQRGQRGGGEPTPANDRSHLVEVFRHVVNEWPALVGGAYCHPAVLLRAVLLHVRHLVLLKRCVRGERVKVSGNLRRTGEEVGRGVAFAASAWAEGAPEASKGRGGRGGGDNVAAFAAFLPAVHMIP